MAGLVRSFFERGTRVEMVFRAAESAVSAALHAVGLVSSSRPLRPGRRGLRPGRRPEASGQVSLRVALAFGWSTLPRAGRGQWFGGFAPARATRRVASAALESVAQPLPAARRWSVDQ